MAIVSNIVAKLKLDNREFNSKLNQSKKNVSGFGSSLKSIGGLMAGAFSVVAITRFANASIKAYDIQAKAEAKLLAALKGRVYVQQRLIQLAQQRQQVTLYGDEETIQAEALLAKMGLQENAIRKLIPLVQDLATIQDMNLATAADLVGKSVGSSTNALTRYGIVIEGAVGSAERLSSAVRALNKQVGGQAEAAANAGTGAIKQLWNAWGDLKEGIGKWLASPANIALIKLLTKYIGGVGDEMAKVKKYTDSGVLTKKWLSTADMKSMQTELDIVTKKLNTFKQSYEQAKAEGNKDKEAFFAGVWDIERENIEKLTAAIKKLTAARKSEAKTAAQRQSPVSGLTPAGRQLYKPQDTVIPGAGGYSDQLAMTNDQLKAMGENLVMVGTNSALAKAGLEQMGAASDKLKVSAQDLNSMLQQVIQAGIQGLADVIVTAFNGGDIMAALGSMLSGIGKMLVSFGSALIAYGLAFKALTNPMTAIPAGIALVAAGIALGAIGGAIAKSATGGGGIAGSYSTGIGYQPAPVRANTDYFASGRNEIILRARGADLVGVLNNETMRRAVNG